ncbi:class I SAM-dependent methyltransferase [Oleispirillum naphthae]|uniref:class I SAM-dependent methyltransferase n=1 Tax=Oleispirillum naphthae TaxID=2838853 RepID=UPI0030822D97
MSSLEQTFLERFGRFAREHATSFAANGHTRTGIAMRLKLYDHLLRRVLPPLLPHPLRILDCGCGNGFLGRHIRERLPVARMDGVDFTPELAELAAESGLYAEVRNGNVLDLGTLFPGEYDLVNSCEVYHYIAPEERAAFWRAHLDRIAPDGRMLLVVPNFRSALRRVRRRLPVGYYFDLDSIRESLAGFPEARIEAVFGIDLVLRRAWRLNAARKSPLGEFLSFELAVLISRNR